ncbi:hypothetical protein TB2_029835 [Malus domestica]
MDTDHQIPDVAAVAEAGIDARGGPRGEASDEEVGDDLGRSEMGKVKFESEKSGGEEDLGVCLDEIGWGF